MPAHPVQFARIFSFSSGSSHHLVRTTSSAVQCSEMSSCEWSACIFCACIVRLQCWQVDNKPGQVEKNPDQGSQFASLELGYHMRTPAINALTQCTQANLHKLKHKHQHKHNAHTQTYTNSNTNTLILLHCERHKAVSQAAITSCACLYHHLDMFTLLLT